jgi:hypothetical protein
VNEVAGAVVCFRGHWTIDEVCFRGPCSTDYFEGDVDWAVENDFD